MAGDPGDAARARGDDVDRRVRGATKVVQRRSLVVAQRGGLAAGQHRCHPASALGHPWVPDRIDAAVDPEQSPTVAPSSDRRTGVPEVMQLPDGHDSVLRGGQLSQG
jgi:hypothetical protein